MFKRTSSAVFLLSVLSIGLAGCQPEEGPAEKAGRAIDESMGKVGAQIESASNRIKESAKEAQK